MTDPPSERSAQSGSGPNGLDPDSVRILDAVLERMLPGDELGGGAREAEVARYIDRALAAEYREHLDLYTEALAAVDGHAVSTYRRPFVALQPEEQDEIVSALERGAIPGIADIDGSFFELLRRHLIEGMFGDPHWGGNAGLLGWRLIGYQGPRLVWTVDDQRLGPAENA